MNCTYCYKIFKSNQTPIYLQTSSSSTPYHMSCAKKELYSYIIRQIDEEEIDLSHYRTTIRSVWPSKPILRTCICFSKWYHSQPYLLEECVHRVNVLIRQQVYP